MRDPKNILEVAALGPDYMGFIFYKESKRYVGKGFYVPKEFPRHIKRVGVFVNERVENILSKVSKHQLDFVQLHGDESADLCRELSQEIRVIKVFRVDDSFDFNSVGKFSSCSDFFMFDTKGENFGGTGKTFNWNLLENYDQKIPFFLSGGLSAGNIPEVREVKNLNLYSLDVNSQVESSPGVKDVAALNSIFSILNSFQNEISSR